MEQKIEFFAELERNLNERGRTNVGGRPDEEACDISHHLRHRNQGCLQNTDPFRSEFF